ncbi:MAG: LysR family transcriptional regulator [Erythrobacter sp.]|uniref:LysR family transcriptional regulator n=1 Tax=Erythrobacter sp. TaxID=1042 RepID=UPI003266C690
MDDLRLLRHFEAVYRLLSFSAAADELGLTHSALTKSIKQIEHGWDVQLFHRTTRTVVATEAGKKLYPMAVELLGFAKNVRTSVQSGEHILNIVSGPAILENMIPLAIEKFARRFPNTRINVETMPPHLAVEELVQRRIHLVLYHEATLRGVAHFNRLRVRNVCDEPYWMLFRQGHPVRQAGDSLEDILGFDWAIAGFDDLFENNLSDDVQALLQAHDFPKYRLLSQAACIDLARCSDIVTAIPKTAACPLIERGEIDGLPHPGGFNFSVSAAVLYDAGVEPTVEHFVDCL